MELTLPIFLAFGVACFIAGLSKGGLGGALGFLITPLLALVMPLPKAVGLMLPVLMLADVFTLASYWRQWQTRLLWVLLGSALVGVSLATFVLSAVSPGLLKKLLAGMVLIFIAYRLAEPHLFRKLAYTHRTWHGLLAGSTAGFASTLANAGGPPITIYLLLQCLEPRVFIATSALFFALLNWIKIPYFYAAGMFDWPAQLRLLWLVPLTPLGVWLGKKLAARLDRPRFERV